MSINVLAICRKIGLKQYELAALLGECHTSVAKIKARENHRQMTIGMYWLLEHIPEAVIPVLLDRWLYEKGKSEEQVRLLLKIAGRFLPQPTASTWQKLVRQKNAEFFF